MGGLIGIGKWLLYGRSSKKTIHSNEQRLESSRVSTLNSQIRLQKTIIDSYEEQIRDLLKQTRINSKGSLEDKALNVAIDMFTKPKKPTIPTVTIENTPQTNGRDLSHKEITEFILKIPPPYLPQLAKSSQEEILVFGKRDYPEVSEESIIAIHNLIKKMEGVKV